MFRMQAPRVKLSVQALNCYVIRDQILNGGADIGIHYDVGGYGTTVTAEKLTDFPLVLIACPSLEKSLCDFTTPGQRKPLCLITSDRDSIFQRTFDDYLKEYDIVLDGLMELGSIEAIKRSVVSNLGVAYLPRFAVEEELVDGSLKELELKLSNNIITAICAYHKNKWISPAMELFISLLKENLWQTAIESIGTQ